MANQMRLEVILCKNKMYKKIVLHVQLDLLLIFSLFSLPPLSITQFYILFEQTINIIKLELRF